MSIIETLSAIQSELKAHKGQFNAFGKYKYRNCEDILEALKPLLAKHKAVVLLRDSIEMVGDRIYVKAIATIATKDDETSVSAYARESENKKGMDDSQITGTASSYARKYALNGLFAIDDTKDSDSEKPVTDGDKKQMKIDSVKTKITACKDRASLEKLWIALEVGIKQDAGLKKAFVIRGSELDETTIEGKNNTAEKANVTKHIEQAKTLEDLEEVKDFVKAFDLVQVYDNKAKKLKG